MELPLIMRELVFLSIRGTASRPKWGFGHSAGTGARAL